MVEHDLNKEIRVSSLESWEFSLRHFVEHVGGCWWRTKGRDDEYASDESKGEIVEGDGEEHNLEELYAFKCFGFYHDALKEMMPHEESR